MLGVGAVKEIVAGDRTVVVGVVEGEGSDAGPGIAAGQVIGVARSAMASVEASSLSLSPRVPGSRPFGLADSDLARPSATHGRGAAAMCEKYRYSTNPQIVIDA